MATSKRIPQTRRSEQLMLLALLTMLIAAAPAWATTILVPDAQPTIQAGIDAASSGDTVIVACGTYYEHDIVMKSGVCLRSETGLFDCVTVDAQQYMNWCRVISCVDCAAGTAIEGFTMTGGYYPDGGGMYCSSSSLMLREILFLSNYSDSGGGIYCVGSSVHFDGVDFEDNWANQEGGAIAGIDGSSLSLVDCAMTENSAIGSEDSDGGGVYCVDSFVTLADCLLSGNEAQGEGGGAYLYSTSVTAEACLVTLNTGGGMACASPYGSGTSCEAVACTFSYNNGTGLSCRELTLLELQDCLFRGNENIGGWGGGLCDAGTVSSTLTGCTFEENISAYGGGLYRSYYEFPVEGCTFYRNSATIAGGGAFFSSIGPGTYPSFTGCTFSENEAPVGSGICNYSGAPTDIAETIIAFGIGGEGCWGFFGVASCNNIYGNEGGDWTARSTASPLGTNGNISADPLFCGSENPSEPLTLDADSPCAPGNTPGCGQIGAWGVGCQTTSTEETTWGSVKSMFE